MIKPKRLKKGDTIPIVSLSWGGLGDGKLIHKYGYEINLDKKIIRLLESATE